MAPPATTTTTTTTTTRRPRCCGPVAAASKSKARRLALAERAQRLAAQPASTPRTQGAPRPAVPHGHVTKPLTLTVRAPGLAETRLSARPDQSVPALREDAGEYGLNPDCFKMLQPKVVAEADTPSSAGVEDSAVITAYPRVRGGGKREPSGRKRGGARRAWRRLEVHVAAARPRAGQKQKARQPHHALTRRIAIQTSTPRAEWFRRRRRCHARFFESRQVESRLVEKAGEGSPRRTRRRAGPPQAAS